MSEASAIAHPNIAFIKYWGNRDDALRLPLNSSLSMNLAGLETRTTVKFDPGLQADSLTINGEAQDGQALSRVSAFLDLIRQMAGIRSAAEIESSNNFPLGAGIASSAAAFAALALAGSSAAGLNLDEASLSRLARRGSGSASRSIPAGFAEWQAGETDEDSFAFSIAEAAHWDLVDLVVVVDAGQKLTGSSEGHRLAGSSPLNRLRQAGLNSRLKLCRQAILQRDFEPFAEVVEADSNWMHAVMRTSKPPLNYWLPATEVLLWQVREWHRQGHAVCTTVDAGPNVHILALAGELPWLKLALDSVEGIRETILARPGLGARLV